jgi:hypothetical protein
MLGNGAVCPECGHEFKGNGFDGIDAHRRANHERIMPYKEAWPLIKVGRYECSTGIRRPQQVHFTGEQRKEYDRLMAKVFGVSPRRPTR